MALLGIVVLAALLRFPTLGLQSLDEFESYTAALLAMTLGGTLDAPGPARPMPTPEPPVTEVVSRSCPWSAARSTRASTRRRTWCPAEFEVVSEERTGSYARAVGSGAPLHGANVQLIGL